LNIEKRKDETRNQEPETRDQKPVLGGRGEQKQAGNRLLARYLANVSILHREIKNG